jgi:hypothetical protein
VAANLTYKAVWNGGHAVVSAGVFRYGRKNFLFTLCLEHGLTSWHDIATTELFHRDPPKRGAAFTIICNGAWAKKQESSKE